MWNSIRRRLRRPAFPAGHFYSPLVDSDDIALHRDEIWPAMPAIHGIDFDDASHRRILAETFPRFIGDYDYPETANSDAAPLQFFSRNSQFGWLDARVLFVLLRDWRPRRIVEVGAGYSTLLMSDVNVRWLEAHCRITCIEPFPRSFLTTTPARVAEVVEIPVQRAPLALFAELEAGDVLFVDSSHVSKTGSDVNFLVFEVLPILQPGVRVHFHDIFLPHDYPPDWVMKDERNWNEQYLVRALLMYSTAFHVTFGSNYALHAYPELVAAALRVPRAGVFGGGSLWITKVAADS